MEDRALALSFGVPGRGPVGTSCHQPIWHRRSQGAGNAPSHCNPAAPASERLPPPARPGAPATRGPGRLVPVARGFPRTPRPPLLRASERSPARRGAREACPWRPRAKPSTCGSGPAHWHPPAASEGPGPPPAEAGPQPCPPQGSLLVPDGVEPLMGSGHRQADVEPRTTSWCHC